MVFNFFDKKTCLGASAKEQLAQELHKAVITKFKRRRAYFRLEDNIQAGDLAEMGSFSSSNQSVKYLLCVIDVFTKYAWVKLLKDKH